MIRIVLDTSYVLPIVGIWVAELPDNYVQLIKSSPAHVKFIYPSPLMIELVAKAAREASKKGMHTIPKRFSDGMAALLSGYVVSLDLPVARSWELAAEIWIRGHKDMMDNIAYAHAINSNAYFMSIDQSFKEFLEANGYATDIIITHNQLRQLWNNIDTLHG